MNHEYLQVETIRPAAAAIMPSKRCKRTVCISRQASWRGVWAWGFVACAALLMSPAFGDDPEDDKAESPSQPATALQGMEELGFSVPSKEGGKTRTRFFGTVGEGFNFVYVFDRSGSMGGPGRTALQAVKAELAESLKNLDTVHQFQIVFYNERPVAFNPAGSSGRLAFATEPNKERALRAVDVIPADGGTNHEDALRLAIRLRPDVIFFLTDADEPELTAAELDALREAAAGIRINTIQFGSGPPPKQKNFLAKLAEQNGGQHAYVDLSKLPHKPSRQASEAGPPPSGDSP